MSTADRLDQLNICLMNTGIQKYYNINHTINYELSDGRGHLNDDRDRRLTLTPKILVSSYGVIDHGGTRPGHGLLPTRCQTITWTNVECLRNIGNLFRLLGVENGNKIVT